MLGEGGYVVAVTESYQDALNCAICHLIIKKATNGCECHVFCHSCLENYINIPRLDEKFLKCPGNCTKKFDPFKSLVPNQTIDMMVNKLKTKCSSQGCLWTGDLLDLVTLHQKECIDKLIIIKCKRRKCEGIFLRKDQEKHEAVCLYKPLLCFYCKMNLWRVNKDEHEVLCSTEKIQCLYHEAGCNTLMYRKDTDKHEQDSQSIHLKLSFKRSEKSVTNLSKVNSYLVENVSILKESAKKANKEINILKQRNKDLQEEVEEVKETLKVEIINLKDESFKLMGQLKETLTGELNLIKEKEKLKENKSKISRYFKESL